MNNSHSQLVASSGNYAVKANGSGTIYTTSPNKRNLYNVRTGEIVFYDPKTGDSYDDNPTTGIANATHLRVGVGVGKKGQLADNIRLLFRDTIKFPVTTGTSAVNTSDRLAYNATASSCSQTQVLDVYFCDAKCGETVSFTIKADTPVLRQYMPDSELATYTFTATPDCGCETCDGTVNMEDLVCKLVDKVNGKFRKLRYDQFFAGNNERDLIQPIRAARLFSDANNDTSHRWDLTPASVGCTTCELFDPITTFKVDNSVVLTFVGTTVTIDGSSYTTASQLESVVEQLNDYLSTTGGSAYIGTRTASGACCTKSIYVNSCITDSLEFVVDGADMAPTLSEAAFAAITNEATGCKDCGGNAPTTTTYEHGIRLFLDPIELNFEGCYPPQQFFPSLHSSMEFGGSTGFGCCAPVVCEKQAGTLAEGLGYKFVELEIGQHNGGQGRNFVYDTPSLGLRGLPEAGTAYTSTTIDAKQNYKVYSFILNRVVDDNTVSGAAIRGYRDESRLLIPTADTATIASWETCLGLLMAKFNK